MLRSGSGDVASHCSKGFIARPRNIAAKRAEEREKKRGGCSRDEKPCRAAAQDGLSIAQLFLSRCCRGGPRADGYFQRSYGRRQVGRYVFLRRAGCICARFGGREATSTSRSPASRPKHRRKTQIFKNQTDQWMEGDLRLSLADTPPSTPQYGDREMVEGADSRERRSEKVYEEARGETKGRKRAGRSSEQQAAPNLSPPRSAQTSAPGGGRDRPRRAVDKQGVAVARGPRAPFPMVALRAKRRSASRRRPGSTDASRVLREEGKGKREWRRGGSITFVFHAISIGGPHIPRSRATSMPFRSSKGRPFLPSSGPGGGGRGAPRTRCDFSPGRPAPGVPVRIVPQGRLYTRRLEGALVLMWSCPRREDGRGLPPARETIFGHRHLGLDCGGRRRAGERRASLKGLRQSCDGDRFNVSQFKAGPKRSSRRAPQWSGISRRGRPFLQGSRAGAAREAPRFSRGL